MKEERILNVLGKVDEKYIKEADPEVKAKRKAPVWTKWGAMAACLALVVLCAVPFVSNWLSHTPSIPGELSGFSDNEPDLGFWCGITGTDTVINTIDTFNATVTFGSVARDVERFVISIDAKDFDIEKSCANELIGGQDYTEADYFVHYNSKMTASDLPFNFQLTLSPKEGVENYSGSIVITIEEYMLGGWGTAKTTIYYYGDTDNICFSTESLENAIDIFAIVNK